MYLPPHILYCIETLEKAGYPAYAVGGCVRDACLGLTPHDYDLCTAAKPEQIKALFSRYDLILAGEKHGTVGVILPQEVVEITTFRTEGDYLDHRHPTSVCFIDDVAGDLARRDFTVNAMAYSPIRGFADPFGGRQDLKDGILRAVGDAPTRFREDALRILRGVRFAVRFALRPEEKTGETMMELAPLMQDLARERVMDEMCKILPLISAAQLQEFAPIITQVIPELAPAVGFDQRNHHHKYDLFTHVAHVVEGVPGEVALRWAALLHDVGKPDCFSIDEAGSGHFYGHATASAELADAIMARMKASTALREQVVTLVRLHMTDIPAEKKTVRRWLSRLGADMFHALMQLQEADMGSKGTGLPAEESRFVIPRQLAREIMEENACLHLKDLAVNGRDLLALGYVGPEIGRALQNLLDLVLEEQLPNEKQALLNYLQTQA